MNLLHTLHVRGHNFLKVSLLHKDGLQCTRESSTHVEADVTRNNNKKNPYKVVSVPVLCEAVVTRNNKKKTFKVVSVQVVCDADATKNNN
jgi:hypothetical protein